MFTVYLNYEDYPTVKSSRTPMLLQGIVVKGEVLEYMIPKLKDGYYTKVEKMKDRLYPHFMSQELVKYGEDPNEYLVYSIPYFA